jgi:hypothetical protein
VEARIGNKKLITVDPEDWQQISRLAFDLGVNRSSLVRGIVRAYLARAIPMDEPDRKSTRKRGDNTMRS